MKNLVSLQPTVLEAPVCEDMSGLSFTSHYWPVCWPGCLGCWWVREWEQSEDLGPQQCSGVSAWPPCPGREPLPLPVCSLVHCTPSWLEPIQWIVLPSSPCIAGESEPLDECSCCRAGAWTKSREKLGKISILLSFVGYQRADSGALVSLVVTAVVSPLGCPGTGIPSRMHSFVCVPGRMLGE